MAADPGEIADEFPSKQTNSGLNNPVRADASPMEFSLNNEKSSLGSEGVATRPKKGGLTELVVSGGPLNDAASQDVMVPMEVDPSSVASTNLAEGDLNGVNVDQESLGSSTDSVPQDSSSLNEEKPGEKSSPTCQPLSYCPTRVEVTEHSTNIDMNESSTNPAYPVYVKSLQEAEEVLHRFENNTKTRFCVWRCPKDFGACKIDMKGKRIYWHEFAIEDRLTVKSDGIPFIMMGRKVYDCHHGRDRNSALKQRAKRKREENDVKKRNVTAPSKKVDCPARIVFCEIIYFPDYKLVSDTKHHRTVIAKTIKQHFTDGKVNFDNIEHRIYLSFPSDKDHKGHPTGKGGKLSQRVDAKVSSKISQLVGIGNTNEKDVKQYLDEYVNRELFPGRAKPFHSNRRYYPSRSVIRIKMYNAYIMKRLSIIDLENIEEAVAQWKSNNPNDKFYFRRHADVNEVLLNGTISGISVEDENEDDIRIRQSFSKQQFLFVHQTSFQSHLLKRYGNHVCFLDPVYRTAKYALPVFFLTVKTNVDYQVVATFVVQDETRDSIKEGLEFLKSWNPDWKPKIFMVDIDSEEISTVEECFPDCKVLFSDFHREQAWERWLSQSANGTPPHKDAILVHLRSLAQAASTDEFEKALETLQQSDTWKCNYGKTFRNWFENTWLSDKERWVWCYKVDALGSVLATNNTIECQSEGFNHEQLVGHGETKLSDVLKILMNAILPAKRDAYFEQNSQFFVTSTKSTNLPSFFHNRPRHLADRIAECMTSSHDITPDDIVVNSTTIGEFLVKNTDSDIEHKVYFGNDECLPYCECVDWLKTMLPCKHFVAIMRDFKEWNWSKFPESYASSPYVTLDETVNPRATEVNPKVTEVNPSATEVNPSATEVTPRTTKVNPSTTEVNPNATEVDPRVTEVNPNINQWDTPGGDESNMLALSLSQVSELLVQRPGEKSKASTCRDVLNEINSITYSTHDRKAIICLYNTLNEALAKLKLSAVDDDLVVVDTIEASPKPVKSEDKKDEKTARPAGTPVKRGKRSSESGSPGFPGVGIANKAAKLDHNAGQTNLPSAGQTNLPCAGNELIPEHVLEEMNHMCLLNIDYYRPVNSTTTVNTSGMPGSSENVSSILFNTSQSNDLQTLTDTTVYRAMELSQLNEKRDSDVAVTYASTPGILSKHEETLALRNEMITCESINLAQALLRETCPQRKGFQNVAGGAVQTFEPVSGDFTQILHDSNQHWVCTSSTTYGASKDPVSVAMYDSMNQGYVAKFVKQQLASFLCIQNSEMKVILKSVQQQTSPVDCGVFAIAFATALAFGQDPSKRRFDVAKMRPHLVECLKTKKMSPFPEMKVGVEDIVMSRRKFFTIELFCSCRMPYEKPKSEADLMAQCGNCKEWFHQRCEKIALEVFKASAGVNFFCSSCLKKA